MPWLEDMPVGAIRELGAVTFTKEDIIRFAKAWDPQRFHVDEEAARKSHFGRLCASGWHTSSACMRLVVDWHLRHDEEMRARGETPPVMGPSPGFRDMKWPRPVFAGDTITYTAEIVETRPSASRPGWGIARQRIRGVNQNGDLVMEFQSAAFAPSRGGAPKPGA